MAIEVSWDVYGVGFRVYLLVVSKEMRIEKDGSNYYITGVIWRYCRGPFPGHQTTRQSADLLPLRLACWETYKKVFCRVQPDV